ncbi:MAG: VUT family protein, partial [Ignavibacteriaceae bacterium]
MQKENEPTSPTSVKKYKFYDFIMAAFVTILLCSNIIGAEKVVSLFGFTFGAGILFFPISYFFNDILTEVYGYARSRKVVWAGFAALGFASIMSAV